jgi:flagellar hook-associated protein 3 FlgL
MRITNNIIQREALRQMQAGSRGIMNAQRQVVTGLRLEKASDDPAATSAAMNTRSGLRALDQYRRNIEMVEARVQVEETILNQLGDTINRARVLGIGANTATSDHAARQAARAEVDELLRFAVQLGNTKVVDEFIFGGRWTDVPPFDPQQPDFLRQDGGAPVVPQGVRETEISNGHFLRVHHDGQEVFLDTGVLQALQQLSDALGDPNAVPDGIGAALTSLQSASNRVQELIGGIGARGNQLEITKSNLSALEINLQTLKSNLEEVDLEKAITELVNRQTAYQAAMLATSKVMGLSLADYLR